MLFYHVEDYSNKSFFTKYLVARLYRVVFQDLPHCCTKYPVEGFVKYHVVGFYHVVFQVLSHSRTKYFFEGFFARCHVVGFYTNYHIALFLLYIAFF